MHYLVAPRNTGEQRVVAAHAAVAELPALLGEPVGLADRGVDVYGHRFLSGTGARPPGPAQRFARHTIQLAHVTPGDRKSTRPNSSHAPPQLPLPPPPRPSPVPF